MELYFQCIGLLHNGCLEIHILDFKQTGILKDAIKRLKLRQIAAEKNKRDL